MEAPSEALRLLQRQADLEARMRNPGGIRVNEERELFELRARLEKYPAGRRRCARGRAPSAPPGRCAVDQRRRDG
jgi:hypothetical protein